LIEAPKPVPSPKDRVLAAWEDSQNKLKSGIGEGIYERSNASGEPLKYAVKIRHSGKKFHIELDYLSGVDSPFPPSQKMVLIYDGETFAYREVNVKFRPHGEEARLESVKDGNFRRIFGYHLFPFNPPDLQSSMVMLPEFLRNRPTTEFARQKDGISASTQFSEKPPLDQTMIFPEKMGYHISSVEFLRADTGYRQSASAKWERSDETWYVREIETANIYPDPPKDEKESRKYPPKGRVYHKLTYDKYEPNAKIDPSLFHLSALGLVQKARFISIDYESKTTSIYRNNPPAAPGPEDESLVQGLQRLPLDSVIKNDVQEPKINPPPKKE
jgi:hypothetical protein